MSKFLKFMSMPLFSRFELGVAIILGGVSYSTGNGPYGAYWFAYVAVFVWAAYLNDKFVKWSKPKPEPYLEWSKVMQPHLDRWKLAASLGASVTHNPEGSTAMAFLVGGMATRLDKAVSILKAHDLMGELE